MKRKYSIFTSVLLAIVLLGSCEEDETLSPSDLDIQIELISRDWVVKSVTLDGNDESINWPEFSISFTKNKSYSASNISDQRLGTVWSSSGTWDFKDVNDLSTIVRNDGVEINMNVDETNCTMSFEYVDPNGRAAAISGAWIFNMEPI